MLHSLKHFPVQLLLLAIFLVSTFSFSAENHKDKIIIGESTRLHSDILGEERGVYISLPSNYHRNIHSYPVIIVMDAEYLFEVASAIVKIKASRNEMPESIVVGIPNSTGKRYDMAMSLRYPNGSTFLVMLTGRELRIIWFSIKKSFSLFLKIIIG